MGRFVLFVGLFCAGLFGCSSSPSSSVTVAGLYRVEARAPEGGAPVSSFVESTAKRFGLELAADGTYSVFRPESDSFEGSRVPIQNGTWKEEAGSLRLEIAQEASGVSFLNYDLAQPLRLEVQPGGLKATGPKTSSTDPTELELWFVRLAG